MTPIRQANFQAVHLYLGRLRRAFDTKLEEKYEWELISFILEGNETKERSIHYMAQDFDLDACVAHEVLTNEESNASSRG